MLPNNNNIITVFFKENVTYLVWICRDLISLILGTWFSLIQGTRWQFSLILETRFSILGTRIRSLKHIKKTLIILLVYCRLVVHTDTIIDTRAWKVVRVIHLFTHQGISLGQKIAHAHHLVKHLMGQVVYTFLGKKEHILLQLKVILCSAA